MKFLSLIALIITSSAFAEVSTDHVDAMLNQMVKEQVISKVEADKARVRMKAMSKNQWSQVNAQAAQAASRMPASVENTEAPANDDVSAADLDASQFHQIQNDMRVIIPQSRD